MTVIRGRLIRKLRRARGWSQTDLAKRAGVSQVQVSRIESGDRGPSLKVLARIRRALEVRHVEEMLVDYTR